MEKIWSFGVKSWFFTRNTPKIVAPPSARCNFFKCAPLTWHPGSAPGAVIYLCARGVDIGSLSTIFLWNVGTVSTVWYFCLFINLLSVFDYKDCITETDETMAILLLSLLSNSFIIALCPSNCTRQCVIWYIKMAYI